MRKRTLSALALLLIGFPALLFGGLPYYLLMGFFLAMTGWEFVNLAAACGARPARWLVFGGVIAVSAARYFFPTYASPILVFTILLLMSAHLLQFERGRAEAGMDFTIDAGALTYVGWLGSYLLDIRNLENGGWWIMFVLPTVWCVDTGAYMLGAAYGKHRMTPRLSPKKSWEGFAAGAFTGMLGGGFFAYAYSTWGPLQLPTWQGALFGLMIGLLTPLGDLGESMLKRQAGLKDSGNVLPGHGGAFDRIDSWIWAAILGYYFITWFVR
jgi:phosphatidate cytidylyltransferase